MGTEAAEVKIKLVLDDQAHAAGQRVGQDMGQIGNQAGQATTEMEGLGMASEVAIGAVAMAAAAAAAAVAGIVYAAHEGFEAALKQAEQIKTLGGSLLMMSNGATLKETTSEAKLLHGELEDMGVQAGVASDKMASAFELMASRSNKPIAEVQKLTGEMANIGRVIPGGIDALSEGFSNIEAGVIKARNPLVMMVAQTGLLHGNAKQVAAEMQKMTPEKQMQIAEEAVHRMSDRVKGMPLGFNELVASLKDMKDQVLESLGGPILDAVTRVMGDVRSFFMAHQTQIMEVAEAIGTRIGEFVTFISDLFVEIVNVFSDDSDQVGASIEDAMEWAADQWDSIKDNAHALAQTFKDIIDACNKILEVAKTVADIANPMVMFGLESDAKILKKMVGGSGDKADVNGVQLSGEQETAYERAAKKFGQMNIDTSKLDKAEAKFRAAAKESGVAADDIDKLVNSLYAAHQTAIETHGGGKFDAAANMSDSVKAAEAFKATWIAAAKAHDVELMKYGASVLEHSAMLSDELRASGIIVSEGMEDLGSYVKDKALKSAISDKMKINMSALDEAAKAHAVNFNGGQTFHIKQDFRDQDPDRVALVFQRDIKNAALNRNQSKMATAFGL
jgi:hypothetical protein